MVATGSGPFVRRVVLENHTSIARCDVTLHPLTVLVGRNGSGKSNFVDALALVADALHTSLDHAMRSQGGINEVRRRSDSFAASERRIVRLLEALRQASARGPA